MQHTISHTHLIKGFCNHNGLVAYRWPFQAAPLALKAAAAQELAVVYGGRRRREGEGARRRSNVRWRRHCCPGRGCAACGAMSTALPNCAGS